MKTKHHLIKVYNPKDIKLLQNLLWKKTHNTFKKYEITSISNSKNEFIITKFSSEKLVRERHYTIKAYTYNEQCQQQTFNLLITLLEKTIAILPKIIIFDVDDVDNKNLPTTEQKSVINHLVYEVWTKTEKNIVEKATDLLIGLAQKKFLKNGNKFCALILTIMFLKFHSLNVFSNTILEDYNTQWEVMLNEIIYSCRCFLIQTDEPDEFWAMPQFSMSYTHEELFNIIYKFLYAHAVIF